MESKASLPKCYLQGPKLSQLDGENELHWPTKYGVSMKLAERKLELDHDLAGYPLETVHNLDPFTLDVPPWHLSNPFETVHILEDSLTLYDHPRLLSNPYTTVHNLEDSLTLDDHPRRLSNSFLYSIWRPSRSLDKHFREKDPYHCPHCNSHTNVLFHSFFGKPRSRSCSLCHRTWFVEKKPMDSPEKIDLPGWSIARSGDRKDAVGLGGVTGIVRNTNKSVAADRQKEIWGKKLKGPGLNFDDEASSSSNCGSGTNQTPSDDWSSHDGKPLSQSPSSPTDTQGTQKEHRIIIDEPSVLNLFDQMLEKIKKDELMKPLFEGATDYPAKLNDVVIGTASTVNIGLVGFAETGSSFSPTVSFLGVANAVAFVCAFTAITLRPKSPVASRMMTKIGGIASSYSIVGAMGMFLPDNIAWTSWVAAFIPAVAVALF